MQVQFNCQKHFYFKLFSLVKKFEFKQFRLAVSSIYPIDRALSGATIPGKSGPENNGKKGVLRIPQSSSITGTSPSDCFVSYPGHSLRWGRTPLQRISRCILEPQPTGQY